MALRVYLLTADLLFRAKLRSVLDRAGGTLSRDELACDLAVVEITPAGLEAIARLRGRGVSVLAFGSHVLADQLRAARAVGADAVPNSQVEGRLRELLG